jgi:hypothetical protein
MGRNTPYNNPTTGQSTRGALPKCNLFVADCYGSVVGFGPKGVPIKFFKNRFWEKPSAHVPFANDWADTGTKIPHWAADSCPRPGDIVAFHTPGGGPGHATIKVGPGLLIYVDRDGPLLGTFDRCLVDRDSWTGRRFYR